jgi:release factor glutamine methyltransferase
MNAKALFDTLVKEITLPEPLNEKQSIAFMAIEKVFGVTRTDVLANKPVATFDQEAFATLIKRINQHEPIQYILEETHFYGRPFFVNDRVLIPRPETEHLVSLVAEEYATKKNVKLLDIGTGSGCIAITLAKELPHVEVLAIDISTEALSVAKTNADRLDATVLFEQQDVLNADLRYKNVTAIVSNPPYVTVSEKDQMHPNVLAYEPYLALFVPDTDPLVFYKAIAGHATNWLAPGGKIFVEINEQLATGVCIVFQNHGFTNTRTIKDIFGKDRIVIASQ